MTDSKRKKALLKQLAIVKQTESWYITAEHANLNGVFMKKSVIISGNEIEYIKSENDITKFKNYKF